MARNPLVEIDLAFGQEILRNLQHEGIEVAVAFWAKLEEYGEWRFFLASPAFDEMGLFQAYSRVASAGHAEHVYDKPIVTILSMRDPIVTGLQQNVRADRPVQGSRVSSRVYGARVIEDGILERVA